MTIRLPRLDVGIPIVNSDGTPALTLVRWWDEVASSLEGTLTDITEVQADILTALNLGNATMPDIEPVTIYADYTGTALDGELPVNVAVKRYNGATDVTTSADWTATLLSGDATFSIGAATGIVEITAITLDSVIEVTSDHNDIERSRNLNVFVEQSDPPPSSSTTIEYDDSINVTTSASYGSANAGPLTLTCGASGEVELAAPLTFKAATSSGPGSYGASGKWQVSAAGAGIWSDVDTEIGDSTTSNVIDLGDGSGPYKASSGSLTVNQTASGLTPGNDYDFELLLRNDSGTHTTTYVGTASATTE